MAVTMKEVRKGARITLRNGWEAEVLDNLTNRPTRMCKVFVDYTEMG
jgi:nitrogen fixation protein